MTSSPDFRNKKEKSEIIECLKDYNELYTPHVLFEV